MKFPVFFTDALLLREVILAYSAKGALEILGKILKLGSGSDAVLGSACLLVIFPSANVTYVFFHNNFLSAAMGDTKIINNFFRSSMLLVTLL